MLNNRQIFGQAGESLAVKSLKSEGYTILEQNYRTPMGEIDIIAMEKGVIVFVEVKARQTSGFGNAKYAVTPVKQKKISMAALAYLKKKGQLHKKARFDVVAIHLQSGNANLEIIRNAFELACS